MPSSNFYRAEIANGTFRTALFSKPLALYVALFNVTPDESGGGTEVSGNGYARVQVDPSDANWDMNTDGIITNKLAISFPDPVSNDDWGVVNGCAIFDAASGGNMYVFNDLTTPIDVPGFGPGPLFNAGVLKITFQ